MRTLVKRIRFECFTCHQLLSEAKQYDDGMVCILGPEDEAVSDSLHQGHTKQYITDDYRSNLKEISVVRGVDPKETS